ncbi:MAG: hypothetical protein IT379_17865 [Deltaproteobacteria bacterium]|nr:hypothetical protein [Deltaproteobacteria bacterium]
MNPEERGFGSGVPALDVSEHGHHIDGLTNYINIANVIFFTLVVAILVWACVAYRARRGARAQYVHGTSKRDFLMAAVLGAVVFLGLDLAIVFQGSRALEESIWRYPTRADNPLQIEILAQQWAWNIRYPGPDGRFNTADDAVTLNDLRIPVDRPVLFNLRSRDVIHSFNLPNFRVKVDAVPGITTRGWFRVPSNDPDLLGMGFPRPVRFNIACAQMCGWAHYAMSGYVTVYKTDEFERWYAQAVIDGRLRYTDPRTMEDADLRRREEEQHWGWDFQDWGEPRPSEPAAQARGEGAHGGDAAGENERPSEGAAAAGHEGGE